ncbi:MAG TPA: OmpA family protein [Herbaspirillum sp.]|jgi:outer membrane protein OmpA-like peptidoglycan-associated protein
MMSCLPIKAQDIDAQKNDDRVRGKMVDRSRVDNAAAAPNTETQDAAFDPLQPSALTTTERRTMLENVAPQTGAQASVSLSDRAGTGHFDSGKAILLSPTTLALDDLIRQLQGKTDIHVEIVGHTDNQRIAAPLRPRYPNNQALSEARALAIAAYMKQRLQAPAKAFAVSGKGESQPVASNGTPAGMAQNRRVEIRVWYREPVVALPQAPQGPRIDCAAPVAAPIGAPVAGSAPPLEALPFSITVDGQPVDNARAQEADGQRCVDVALERADIQIKYDPLNATPALNVWVAGSTAVRGKPIFFGSYTNYAWWLRKGELRVFAKGQTGQETPLAVIPLKPGEAVQWQAPDAAPTEMMYLLRVYDDSGKFDETLMKPLRLADRGDPLVTQERINRERLAGWGESSLRLQNIPARGGSVTISGERVKPDEFVTAMGMPVPVDDKGKFVMRQILPAGPHSVEVAVKDAAGVGASFRRNLSIADKDWFYVAMADLTFSRDKTSGPAQLVTQDTTHYNNATAIDGRGAFYLKGKIRGDYLLTASADTQEQPLKDLFSNFMAKDPNYLLRRIDPDRYYPVYGDDSTVVDDAPTQGKFYVRIEKDGSSAMWGNFQTAWTGTELTQYSRGLYGANLVWNDQKTTKYGEKVSTVNAFVADPGTLQSREEFRGTGGSLYYLQHLDATEGSERLWVEVRDKDSGLAIQRTPLTQAQDYEIDYIQGRVTLRAPLPSVSDGSTLIQTSTANGNPVFLIATYEYVPGLTEVTGNALGLRGSHWFNDHVRVGGSIYRQGQNAQDQNLQGLDTTLRYKPGTWVKGEVARSSGIGNTALTSLTGGFDFAQNQPTDKAAMAERFDAALDLSEISNLHGRISAYFQHREEGFSGPGLATAGGEAMTQKGMTATMPVGQRTEVSVKVDERDALSQTAKSAEGAIRHKIDAEWGVSAGLREDNRNSANVTPGVITVASPTLAQNGSRTDVIVRLDYRPLQDGEAEKLAAMQDGDSNNLAATYASAPLPRAGESAALPMPTTSAQQPPAMPSQAPADSGNGLAGGLDRSGPASTLLPGAMGSGSADNRATLDATSSAGVAAARVPGLQYKPWDSYGFVQGTVARTGDRGENDRAGLGGSYQVSNRLRLGAEASGGSGGVGGRLSGDYQVDDRSTVYLTYTMETESQDNNYAGRQGTLTSGTHYRYSDQVGMFGETRWSEGAGPKSLTHAFGVDFAPDAHWTTGVKYETGTLSDPVSGDLKRNAVSLTAAYKYQDLKYTGALEYRTDKSTTLGSVAGVCMTVDVDGNCTSNSGSSDRRTWLLKNSVQYQYDPAWRLLGKLNLSRSVASQGAFYDGDYSEIVMGAAYRPIDNDRWNTLFKYTYFYNLPSPGQIDSVTGGALDFTQKSHVLDVDSTYDLLPWLSVGGKYGLRMGSLTASKDGSTGWFSSRADLMVLRLDLHLVKEWDALVEARRLRVKEADDARSGFLVGVYRHVTDNVKIGVGYNFTDFSDDLTDMSYRSHGFFLNALATF